MTYRPAETAFGPPFRLKIPSFVYLLVALAAIMTVVVAEKSPAGSWLYVNIVARGQHGFIGARTVAFMLVLGAISSMVRANMRGVRLRSDGVEYRDILTMGLPKLRRYRWAQIDRIVLDLPDCIALDVWDGTRVFLPEVADRDGLSAALEKTAAARAIPVRGGAGLDEIPDAPDFAEESEA
jgi:hypothetical protein